jgi:ribosomal protein L29
MIRRWLVRIAATYAGIGAVVYMLYRAAYLRTQEVRAWTDRSNEELQGMLDELRDELRALRLRKVVRDATSPAYPRKPLRQAA